MAVPQVIVSGLALALLLAACDDRRSGGPASPFTSTDITGVEWGRDFDLTDHNGVPRRLADFNGTTATLAKDFKVHYSAQQADAQDNYTVDHSGGIFVFDPHGRLRLFAGGQRNVAAMAADVALLLKD